MNIVVRLFLLCQLAMLSAILPVWGADTFLPVSGACDERPDHPATYTIGDMTYHYQYDERGRVLSRKGEYSEIRFAYVPQHDHPVRVSRIIGEAGRPEWTRLDSRFIYNADHDLVYAGNSEGNWARYAINNRHQISAIESDRGEHLDIEYDARCDKPARLSLRSVGILHINYDAACEILKVVGPEDAAIANRISMRFDQLLELAAPMSMDLYH